VDFKKDHFIGAAALAELDERGPSRQIVGLEISLDDYEYLYQQIGLPPQFPLAAWRGSAPVYKDDRQVGHATTGAWSPALKKYIALAAVDKNFIQPGSRLDFEVTVDHARKTASATVVKLPFFDPPRKRALFAAPNGR
jgi:aminomethyltransferase